MYYVYLIKSEKNPLKKYIGCTNDLVQQLETHNSGGSIHTKLDRPWQLVMYFAFDSQLKDFEFEKYMLVRHSLVRRREICSQSCFC